MVRPLLAFLLRRTGSLHRGSAVYYEEKVPLRHPRVSESLVMIVAERGNTVQREESRMQLTYRWVTRKNDMQLLFG